MPQDQTNFFRAQANELTTIATSMQDVARTYADRSVTSGDLEAFQKRIDRFKDALHTMYWAFHSASFDVRSAERDAERATRKGSPSQAGATCAVVFGGETFNVPEGADIATRKGSLYVNGDLIATKWIGANISMVGGTFGNVSLS